MSPFSAWMFTKKVQNTQFCAQNSKQLLELSFIHTTSFGAMQWNTVPHRMMATQCTTSSVTQDKLRHRNLLHASGVNKTSCHLMDKLTCTVVLSDMFYFTPQSLSSLMLLIGSLGYSSDWPLSKHLRGQMFSILIAFTDVLDMLANTHNKANFEHSAFKR